MYKGFSNLLKKSPTSDCIQLDEVLKCNKVALYKITSFKGLLTK